MSELAKTENHIPACHDLLDARTRRAITVYSTLGYVGFLFRELTAYVAILEEELAKRENP